MPVAAAPAATSPTPAAGRLEIRVAGLRNQDGALRLCLTRDPAFFPDCQKDRNSRRLVAEAASAGRPLVFENLEPGAYALSVIHDENGNARLDKMAGIPREGFGFSRNPAIRFGPPDFTQVHFQVGSAPVEQQVKLRYLF